MGKESYLSVRINPEQRATLEKLAERRGAKTNFSDVTRLLIDQAGDDSGESIKLPTGVFEKLRQMAAEVERTPEAVLADCVNGMASMLEGNSDRPPLLVAEIKLRRQYRQPNPAVARGSRATKAVS